MTTISKTAKTVNTVTTAHSTSHPLYGAVPPTSPLTVGTVYTTNNTGLPGQFLTNGLNGTSWSHNNIPDNVLVAKGNPASLEVTGKMIINGRDLEERLKTIETVLQIPERDVILEKKHPKLKKLYDEYIAALGKYRTFEAIKGDE